MAENLDQSMIDQLVATAEEDTPEGKIAKLEKEVETLKGSIKRLLMDIRETMNNLENPFQSLQNLAEVISMPTQPQQVQIIPPSIPEPEKKEKEETEKQEEEKTEESSETKAENGSNSGTGDVSVAEAKSGFDSTEKIVRELDVGESDAKVADFSKVRGDFKSQEKVSLVKVDILELYDIIEWISDMLEKYDITTLRDLIDAFWMAGYLSEDLKDLISKIIGVVNVVRVNGGIDRLIIDIYKLYKILHPDDPSIDSKIVTLLLEKSVRSRYTR